MARAFPKKPPTNVNAVPLEYAEKNVTVQSYLPAIIGTDAYIQNPLFADVAKTIAGASVLQNFLDQELGPSVGRAVNDASVAIAAGDMKPEDGATLVQDAWNAQ